MSVQSRQALRLIKLVAEMRKNNYPNAQNFAELMRQADVDENVSCACSPRTVLRDLAVLQEDYGAPIEYDASRRGYFLCDPQWEFSAPIMGDDILSMTLLGTKLASDFLPEPLKTDVDTAVAKALSGNHSDFFDRATIETLLCATTIKATVDPAIFKTVFDGWRRRQVVILTYRRPDGREDGKHFEPHIIAFHNGIWYAKGYEARTKNVKCYAIQRIVKADFDRTDAFEIDRKLLAATRRNGLFEYPRIDGIRLHCDASIAFYLYEHQRSRKFKIERQKDGSLIITLKPAFEHDVLRWVLGEGGKIEVLYPAKLREKVAAAGKILWERNRKKHAGDDC
ncbi:MAG: WYL domain-containing protein [Victivallaceae bacterium]|nr:WYL domain-containing protein [Victivallaceae bacterium]